MQSEERMPPESAGGRGCGSTLPPVVMTIAINANSPYSKARNATMRREWAAATLERWMRLTTLNIVVVDGTADAAALEFLRPLGNSRRLELLAMPRPVLRDPIGQSKGYMEYRSIAFAAGNARALRACAHFAHATGDRFITNAEELLRSPGAARSLVGVVQHGSRPASPAHAPVLHRPDGPVLKSSFVLWTREFLTGEFRGENITEPGGGGAVFEMELGRAVARAWAAGRPVLWWPCVGVLGWSGTSNMPINGAPNRCSKARYTRTKVLF